MLRQCRLVPTPPVKRAKSPAKATEWPEECLTAKSPRWVADPHPAPACYGKLGGKDTDRQAGENTGFRRAFQRLATVFAGASTSTRVSLVPSACVITVVRLV